jgi:hypothetical protein
MSGSGSISQDLRQKSTGLPDQRVIDLNLLGRAKKRKKLVMKWVAW